MKKDDVSTIQEETNVVDVPVMDEYPTEIESTELMINEPEGFEFHEIETNPKQTGKVVGLVVAAAGVITGVVVGGKHLYKKHKEKKSVDGGESNGNGVKMKKRLKWISVPVQDKKAAKNFNETAESNNVVNDDEIFEPDKTEK